jgi:hypothetical protein
MFRALRPVRGDRQIPATPVEPDHPLQGGEASVSRGTANGINSEKFDGARDKLPVPMLADQHRHSPPVGEERHHEEPLVPKSGDKILTPVPEFAGQFLAENLFADGKGEETQDERIESGDNQQKKFLSQAPPAMRL